MKQKYLLIAIISIGLFAAVSCKQDPIFHIIASEIAPIKPRIEGAPTNMVVFEREYSFSNQNLTVPMLFAASGGLHWYARERNPTTNTLKNESYWDISEYDIPQPGGKIISLAATSEYLYALCITGHGVDSTLKRLGRDSTEWKDITTHISTDGYTNIQSIYADPAGVWLFAEAFKGDKNQRYNAILYLDSTGAVPSFRMIKSEISACSGTVYQNGIYYISTKGDGIFQITEAALSAHTAKGALAQLTDKSADDQNNNRKFMNMIKLEDNTIIAIERNGGALFKIESGSFTRMKYTMTDNKDWITSGRYATGALALWEDKDRSLKLLIAGIQGNLYNTSTSSYTHGYVEFELKSDGSFNTGVTRRDPGRLLSVLDNDRYTSSLGKHPINHLFQAPKEIDPSRADYKGMTFFASTQKAGLWSYRDRPHNGGEQWNAEE